ncbi:hypothetical protein N9933_01015, partial [bacterium]|nr:hypothetical protein [bacterium]
INIMKKSKSEKWKKRVEKALEAGVEVRDGFDGGEFYKLNNEKLSLRYGIVWGDISIGSVDFKYSRFYPFTFNGKRWKEYKKTLRKTITFQVGRFYESYYGDIVECTGQSHSPIEFTGIVRKSDSWELGYQSDTWVKSAFTKEVENPNPEEVPMKFEVGKFYQSRYGGVIVECTGQSQFQENFSGIARKGNGWELGGRSNGWEKSAFIKEVEMPEREQAKWVPAVGGAYVYPNPSEKEMFWSTKFRGTTEDRYRILLGICYPYTDQGRADAIAHAKLMLKAKKRV